jgi:hypothetical protein
MDKGAWDEMMASVWLAAASGAIIAAVTITTNDHDVRQYYAINNKRLYYVYVTCSFLLWLSFALNMRYTLSCLAKWLSATMMVARP